MAKPKTDVDWAILRASTMPGPGENHRPMKMAALEKRGGQFRKGNAKSDVDWQVLRASQVRAGCMVQYAFVVSLELAVSVGGCAFIRSFALVSSLSFRHHPCQPSFLFLTQRLSLSSSSVSLPPSLLYASPSSKIPGPGRYKDKGTLESGGGKFNLSKPKSHVEWMIHNASQIPGPGQYEQPLDIKSKKMRSRTMGGVLLSGHGF